MASVRRGRSGKVRKEVPLQKPLVIEGLQALSAAHPRSRCVTQDCSICLEEVKPSSRSAFQSATCEHDFHVECLAQWVVTSGELCCPNCRRRLTPFVDGTTAEKLCRVLKTYDYRYTRDNRVTNTQWNIETISIGSVAPNGRTYVAARDRRSLDPTASSLLSEPLAREGLQALCGVFGDEFGDPAVRKCNICVHPITATRLESAFWSPRCTCAFHFRCLTQRVMSTRSLLCPDCGFSFTPSDIDGTAAQQLCWAIKVTANADATGTGSALRWAAMSDLWRRRSVRVPRVPLPLTEPLVREGLQRLSKPLSRGAVVQTCVICRDGILSTNLEEMLQSSRCRHAFHVTCLTRWVVSAEKVCCPCCEERLTPDPWMQPDGTDPSSELPTVEALRWAISQRWQS